MDPALWLSLTAILLLGAMSPGPSIAVIIAETLRGGARRGALAALGHGAGIALYAMMTLAGLAVVLAGSPNTFLALQLLGALYLLWLGIGSLRSPGARLDAPKPERQDPGGASVGFLIAFLNPKVAVFMLALFSQFLAPDAGWVPKLIMVATAGTVDALWYLLVVAMVSRRAFLRLLRNHSKTIDRVLGLILLVVALTVLVRALATYPAG
ncbi:MAG: LysE family translocator [Pseudomonadota bacterium]